MHIVSYRYEKKKRWVALNLNFTKMGSFAPGNTSYSYSLDLLVLCPNDFEHAFIQRLRIVDDSIDMSEVQNPEGLLYKSEEECFEAIATDHRNCLTFGAEKVDKDNRFCYRYMMGYGGGSDSIAFPFEAKYLPGSKADIDWESLKKRLKGLEKHLSLEDNEERILSEDRLEGLRDLTPMRMSSVPYASY